MNRDDTRYYTVIHGRHWRRSDPRIPPCLRDVLVRELMRARRATKAAKAQRDRTAEAGARARVQDAKVALGERGPKYWQPLQPNEQRIRIQAALRALARGRGEAQRISISEAARIVDADDGRARLPLAEAVARELIRCGDLRASQIADACD